MSNKRKRHECGSCEQRDCTNPHKRSKSTGDVQSNRSNPTLSERPASRDRPPNGHVPLAKRKRKKKNRNKKHKQQRPYVPGPYHEVARHSCSEARGQGASSKQKHTDRMLNSKCLTLPLELEPVAVALPLKLESTSKEEEHVSRSQQAALDREGLRQAKLLARQAIERGRTAQTLGTTAREQNEGVSSSEGLREAHRLSRQAVEPGRTARSPNTARQKHQEEVSVSEGIREAKRLAHAAALKQREIPTEESRQPRSQDEQPAEPFVIDTGGDPRIAGLGYLPATHVPRYERWDVHSALGTGKPQAGSSSPMLAGYERMEYDIELGGVIPPSLVDDTDGTDGTEDSSLSFMTPADVSCIATELDWAPIDTCVPPGTTAFYAVRRGHRPGIYYHWFGKDGAQEQVERFSRPHHRKFSTLSEALEFMDLAPLPEPQSPVPVSKALDLPTASPNPQLCEEQKDLVKLIMEGHNVFYTGSAGTGKSTVLRAFVSELVGRGKRVEKVGPTGLSALNVGGQTYFMYAGWNISSNKLSIDELEKCARSKRRWRRINRTDVLVIDEISMFEAHQFERLDRVCRAARQPRGLDDLELEDRDEWEVSTQSPHDPELPFGGMQVIVTGDFCQLPPVRPFSTCFPCGKELCNQPGGPWTCDDCEHTFRIDDQWAFRSDAWRQCSFKPYQLTQIHRQSDPQFVEILETLRTGQWPSKEQVRLLLDHPCETEGAVKLYPRNKQVQKENQRNLDDIDEQSNFYQATDCCRWNSEDHPHLEDLSTRGPEGYLNALNPHLFAPRLELKKGMLVMLLANVDPDAGLVNGRQGRVLGFKEFSPGLLKSTDPKDPNYFPGAKGAHAQYRDARMLDWLKICSKSTKAYWPVVQFWNGPNRIIYPMCQVQEMGDVRPYSLLSRTQLPLAPAWALSIHKSQGMTLDRVIVDLDEAFEREMVYVALSRARGLKGLKVVSRDGLSILQPGGKLAGGNPAVREFMQKCFGKPKAMSQDDVG